MRVLCFQVSIKKKLTINFYFYNIYVMFIHNKKGAKKSFFSYQDFIKDRFLNHLTRLIKK